MKKEELRIGNWIVGDGDNQQRPTQAKFYDIEFAHLFNPITLTHEWLEKFGYSYSHQLNQWTKGNIILYCLEPDKSIPIFIPTIFGEVEINHVHHFQNIVFDLSGDEI